MDERRNAILAEFREFLESAITKAKVNFATAERLSDQLRGDAGAHGAPLEFISKSTLHEHVRGRRRQRLPSWAWLTNLWAFLLAAAAQNNVDPAKIGTLEEWQTVYDTTATKLRRLDKGLDTTATPADSDLEARSGAERASGPPSSLPVPLIEPHTTWWASYARVVPPWFQRYLNLEPLCGYIRCYENLYIPGLLQTEEYAEAVIRLRHTDASEDEIRQRVELRMLRQDLKPHGGRCLWALINETALRNPPLYPAAMQRQLQHLITMSDQTPIQIVPANAPACQTATGPITILRFGHGGIPDTVYLEEDNSALYPDDPSISALYAQQFGNLTIAAHRPHETRDIIGRLINRT